MTTGLFGLQTPTLPLDEALSGSQDTAQGNAAADTATDVFSTLGQDVSTVGRLLLDGDWGGLWTLLVDGAVNTAASLLPRLFSAAFVALALYVVYRMALGAVDRVLRRSRGVSQGIHTMAVKTLRVVGIGFIALVALSQLGLNVSAVIAGLGIAGLAVGFAAQDSLANFIAGITILLDQPFHVGDWIKIGDTEGRVRDMTLRSTRIVTRSREVVVIPNEQMVKEAVTNQSGDLPLRVEIPFGVAYKEDLDETRRVVLASVDGVGRLAPSPAPDVVVTTLNSSSVDFLLRFHVHDAELSVPLKFEYTEKIRKALGAADIEIPFPHLQLFVDGVDGLQGLRLDGGEVQLDVS
jgi:small conductance mechanosensitive channel